MRLKNIRTRRLHGIVTCLCAGLQQTGEAHYYSRSRKCLWHKGGTSGHVQKVKSIRLDCDGDAVVLLIEQIGGAACHEGYRSCFSRELRDGKVSRCSELVFDPKEVYNG